MPNFPIPVYLQASDPVSRAGVAGQLRHRPELRIVPEREMDRAVVAVLVIDVVDGEATRRLAELRRVGVGRLVVVARRLGDADLVALVEAGVGGMIRRSEATADRLVTVIRGAAVGEGSIPPDLLGRLLAQVGRVSSPGRLTYPGLADREVQVLSLVAEGLDTAEIALKLSYSPRTVKNVLHDITSRLHLRNRSHAVAYALRHGLI